MGSVEGRTEPNNIKTASPLNLTPNISNVKSNVLVVREKVCYRNLSSNYRFILRKYARNSLSFGRNERLRSIWLELDRFDFLNKGDGKGNLSIFELSEILNSD